MRGKRGILFLLSVLLLLALVACNGGNSSDGDQKTRYTSATISAGFTAGTSAKPLAAAVGTVADVASITVDVKNGTAFITQGASLTNSNGVWSASIGNLPIGPQLTFIGHAYNSASDEIFTGTTTQAMTGTNDQVVIAMAPASSGTQMLFPRIVQISRPAEIATTESASISISVEGSSGETLSYAITAAADGGSLTPSSGSITLNGTTGTIVVNYTAPASAGVYTHSITVKNSQGNSVETSFDTNIVSTVTGAGVTIQFNPVITAVSAERSGTYVTFTAAVSDDGPAEELRYLWSFDNGLSFKDPSSNPAALLGYSETVSGTLTLTVTDQNGTGGSTTLSYLISQGQFPDSVVVDTPPTPPTDPSILASGLSTIKAMTVDGTNVYWTESVGGTVKKVALTGGPVTTLASGLSSPSTIAVDGTSVYWAEAGTSTIKKIGINGGAVTTVTGGVSSPVQMAVDATSVYFKEGGSCPLYKVAKTGGLASSIVSSLGTVTDLVVDATSVYWTETTGTLHKVGINGGVDTILASMLNMPSHLVVDATNIYWTEQNAAGTVKKISINGGMSTTLASGLSNPSYIAKDSTNVYWTEAATGSIKRVGINGGLFTTWATGLTNLNGLALSATNVVWAENSTSGAIKSLPK